MNIDFHDFKGETFSFHDDPVLVLENFWGAVERRTIRDAMAHAKWTALKDMPHVYRDFPNSGNWKKADMARDKKLGIKEGSKKDKKKDKKVKGY